MATLHVRGFTKVIGARMSRMSFFLKNQSLKIGLSQLSKGKSCRKKVSIIKLLNECGHFFCEMLRQVRWYGDHIFYVREITF